jgi:type VI secretion system protein ImpK
MLTVNPLLELCHPILQLTAVFYTGDRGKSLPEDYQTNLTNTITALERRALAKQIPSLKLQHIKYAMVAFIDEAVLNSAWSFRTTWMGNPLQLQYFGEHTAGEGFFKHLTELRQAGTQFLDVLEIYYLCLQLGFQGMYRVQGLEKLFSLHVDLCSQIETARGPIDPYLAPQGLPQQNIVAKVGRKLPFWIIASSTGVLLFCIYLGYSIAINHQAHKVLQNIATSRSQLIQNHMARGNNE